MYEGYREFRQGFGLQLDGRLVTAEELDPNLGRQRLQRVQRLHHLGLPRLPHARRLTGGGGGASGLIELEYKGKFALLVFVTGGLG